jgi:hypothetical protein
MSIDATERTNAVEIWNVELPDGVRSMTAPELNDAIESGLVGPRTMVLKSDAVQWRPLGNERIAEEFNARPRAGSASIPPMATDLASPPLLTPQPSPARVDFSFGGAVPSDRAELRTRRAIFGAALTCAIVALFFAAYGTAGISSTFAALARSSGAREAAALAPPSAPAPEPPPAPAPEPPKAIPAPPATGLVSAADPADKDEKAKKHPSKAKKHRKAR